MNTRQKTCLYLIPTPIGNLGDFTFRAVKTLGEVDVILAEDTRTSGVLLKHYDIRRPLQPFHSHNEHRLVDQIINRLKGGEVMALLTDAGTPGISDPGFLLVRACVQNDLAIECLPGATAFVPALVKSGLPSDRFAFEGFLPHKKGRQTALAALTSEPRTMIFYESPHRLAKTLEQFAAHFGADRPASVSRELTKIYEETVNGTLEQLCGYFTSGTVKGECVIVVAGCTEKKTKHQASPEENDDPEHRH